MENKNIEVSKFAQKANHYRKALNQVKYSRILEIFPILSIIEGYIYENGLDKNNLKIVDLMAGNGYLSYFLSENGYKNIYSIEACNEMSFDSEFLNNSNSKLFSIPNIKEINELLNDIEPDIIISLASFHHLIEYDTSSNIDINNSIALQKRIIGMCIDSLDDNGILIIADIHNLTKNENLKKINYWHPKNISNNTLLETHQANYLKKLINSNSLSHFNSLVNQLLLKTNNKSLSTNWFRNIVDKNTSIGHKDVAINEQSLKEFSTVHNYRCEIVNCPWIFDSEEQMLEFVKLKFGFLVGDNPQLGNLKEHLENILGIFNVNKSLTTLGWELAILTFDVSSEAHSKKNLSLRKLSYYTYTLFFSLTVYFLSSRLNLVYIDEKLFWTVWSVLGGAIFSEIFNLIFWNKRKKRKQRIKPSR